MAPTALEVKAQNLEKHVNILLEQYTAVNNQLIYETNQLQEYCCKSGPRICCSNMTRNRQSSNSSSTHASESLRKTQTC